MNKEQQDIKQEADLFRIIGIQTVKIDVLQNLLIQKDQKIKQLEEKYEKQVPNNKDKRSNDN